MLCSPVFHIAPNPERLARRSIRPHNGRGTMRSILQMAALGLAFCLAGPAAWAQAPRQPGDYPLTADSLAQPRVAHGTLEGPFEFHSRIFAGTVRRYWVYVPA